MIIDKVESTIIVRHSKKGINEFIDWLKKEADNSNLEIIYFVKKRFLLSSFVTIVSTGLEKDVKKFEKHIKYKLLYE